ncbi:hypothetical protein ACOSQ3_019727 [Xanthoceras sorbifolium]
MLHYDARTKICKLFLCVPSLSKAKAKQLLTIMHDLEHRVLASSSHKPRSQLLFFFHPSEKESIYRPFPELILREKPAHFQQFTYTDLNNR